MKKYLAIFLLMLVVPLTISAQQTITVTGTVTDTQDEPMIGVNITVKDVAGLGTITDINGNFSIKMEPYHRLVFSYIGYDDVEVLVKEQHTVNVKMKESEASVLDEVVVTGMGAQKKLTVTGAVTNVNVGDLKRFPTSNMSNALMFRVLLPDKLPDNREKVLLSFGYVVFLLLELVQVLIFWWMALNVAVWMNLTLKTSNHSQY